MVVQRSAVGQRRVHVRAQASICRDPLPGHRASSTPVGAVGAAAGWPWPVSPGCPPPAGAPGPGCPFLRCAAAVAASSPARAARVAQPSDWTSERKETPSANTHSAQPCRHDNLSIHILPSSRSLRRAPPLNQNAHAPNSFGTTRKNVGTNPRKLRRLLILVGE